MRPSSCNDARLTFYMMLKCIYTLVTLHKSKLPECIYTEGHIAIIPGRFALKHMYMLYCTFAMSDCISQMLEFHFGLFIITSKQVQTQYMQWDLNERDKFAIYYSSISEV